jgi:hypothetical protein
MTGRCGCAQRNRTSLALSCPSFVCCLLKPCCTFHSQRRLQFQRRVSRFCQWKGQQCVTRQPNNKGRRGNQQKNMWEPLNLKCEYDSSMWMLRNYVFEPIISIAEIGVNIKKHKLYNDIYDVIIIKINVYIAMILSNKLIHIKKQCKQLDNRSEHLYVSICLTTQTCATCMSTIRYVAHPSQKKMWTCISNNPSNIDIRKDNVCIENCNANVKT